MTQPHSSKLGAAGPRAASATGLAPLVTTVSPGGTRCPRVGQQSGVPPLATHLSVAPLRSLHLVLLQHRPPERQLCPSRVPRPQKNETDAPQAAQVGSWGSGTTGDPTPHPFTPNMERNRSSCPCWVTALMSPGSKPLKTVPTPVPLRWPVLLAFPSRFLSLRQQLLVASRSAFCFLPLFSQGKTLRSRPRSGSSQGDAEPTAPVPVPKPRCRALGSGNPALDTWEWGRGLRVGAKPPELP